MFKKLLLIFFLQAVTSVYAIEKSKIRVWEHTKNKPGIIGITLNQALEITREEYGDYEFIISTKMKQERALRELANDRLDVAHFVSTNEREKQVSPIRIPIMQGLLGYRLCLIKQENQKIFADITNKQQWIDNNITIGQHESWPDTTILRSNGIDVRTTFKRELLFQQLSKNRFDCFSRGVSEIMSEKKSNQALQLAIEDNLVIYYPLPQFFYVNPARPILAERLEKGLIKLRKKNETKKIFDDYYREQLEQLKLSKRIFIELKNPTLSQQTIEALQPDSINFREVYLSANKTF